MKTTICKSIDGNHIKIRYKTIFENFAVFGAEVRKMPGGFSEPVFLTILTKFAQAWDGGRHGKVGASALLRRAPVLLFPSEARAGMRSKDGHRRLHAFGAI